MDDSEIALLGRSGTIVSHQAAMAANRDVIPPIPALRAAGCPIANGTDNNTNDMLKDATLGGARALRQNLVGSLEVGKKADLIVLDTQKVHLVPSMRVLSAWIHNGQPSDVESVTAGF